MKKSKLLSLVLLITLISGCTNEFITDERKCDRNGETLPIEFVMGVSEMINSDNTLDSRVIKDSFEFEEGDIIHINAVFTLLDNTTVKKYDCLELKNGKWISRDEEIEGGKTMSWPWDADKATFEAYYVSHSTGILETETKRLLDELCNEADPVYAKIENVNYGGAVKLDFKHLCAKLIIKGLKEGQKEFWLQKDGLKDAFSLQRNKENESEESLNFKFFTADSDLLKGQDNRIIGTSDGKGSVTFYLAPGNYSNMNITYSYGVPYLMLTDIADLGNLEGNKVYSLTIEPGAGNVEEADEDDGWENPEEPGIELSEDEIDDLLKAIHDGTEYVTENGTIILVKENNGTVLLKNVDFKNNNFTPKSLPNGTVFDGKYHYIKNIKGSSLFTEVNGVVRNLGIYCAEISDEENSSAGILASKSSSSAEISNLHLINISIIKRPTIINEICDVGSLFGTNNGKIDKIRLGGKITVEVTSGNVPARVHIGGLIGQSSGYVSDVSLLSDDNNDLSINVICDCEIAELGKITGGDRYVGGLVGLSTGITDNCMIKARVSSANTQGVLIYTGGLIGMVRGTAEGKSDVSLSNSVASCEVTGGMAFPINETANGEGRSYTGGLVGYVYSASSIISSKSMGTVKGHDYKEGFKPFDNAFYALGGAFGQIYNVKHIQEVDARADIETNLQFNADDRYYKGKFAGRSDIDYMNGNSCHNTGADNEIGEIGNISYE